MNSQSLANEFLRLSGLYPELRHAIVIGNEQWRSLKLPRDEMRMFDDPGLKLIEAHGVVRDRFAHYYCLWHGNPDQGRERIAVDEFHRLAQIAADIVPLRELPSRGGPVQLTCKASAYVVKPQEGFIERGIPQVQMPLIDKWVAHTILANGVVRRPCEMHSKNTIGTCQVMLLPLDSFRASAIALGAAIPPPDRVDLANLPAITSPHHNVRPLAAKELADRSQLNKTQKAALEAIERDAPILGKNLAKRLKIEPATLYTHVIPRLRQFGVVSGDEGYSIAKSIAI